MINIEKAVNSKFPAFAQQPAIIRKTTLSALRKITGEREINQFLELNEDVSGFAFIEELFDYFNFECSVDEGNLNLIPSTGPIIIIANHPTGSLDGLALLNIVGKVRHDIKIVGDRTLGNFRALDDLLIRSDKEAKYGKPAIIQALEKQEAVIIFPAGDISRASPTGIKDKRWRSHFLQIAQKTKSPILPIFIEAKNSLLFYCSSFFLRPLKYLLSIRELFSQRNSNIRVSIGSNIAINKLSSQKISDQKLAQRIKKHLYKLGEASHKEFITEKPIAKPEKVQHIEKCLLNAETLGKTKDDNAIYIADYHKGSSLIREIGRLREYTFRKVGEGTGSSRDLDNYDKDYRHLVLWDKTKEKVAGAYRIGEANKIIKQKGIGGLYTSSLYEFTDQMPQYLSHALELGRSFVHPDYWGKSSLDYLWQGIGAFLRYNPDIRYLIGPVSMSAEYPKVLIDELAFYFEKYYKSDEPLAIAYHPYHISLQAKKEFEQTYASLSQPDAFEVLQQSFKQQGHKIPVLFKQYTSLFEENGIKLLAFSIDPDFSDCVDGLLMADLTKLKKKKRARYIGEE